MSDHALPLSDLVYSDLPSDLQPDINPDFQTSLLSILSTASFSSFISSFDFSRLITQLTSLVIIIYSSHRSFRVQRAQILEYNNSISNNDEELDHSDSNNIWTTLAPNGPNELHLHSKQAMMLPLGASFSLLMMFLFFDYLQLFFSTFTAIMAFFSIYLLTHDVIPYLFCCIRHSIFKKPTLHNTITTIFSLLLTSFWILTSHWLIMDVLGAALCVMMITFLRIPNLKTGTILLVGLLVYDVFWVFGTSYLFNRNVMLEMATKNSKNPVRIVIDKVVKIEPNGALDRHITKELVLPGKLIFPNYDFERNMMVGYSMLGLGDIVMPGIIIAFLYTLSNKVYYRTGLFGYFVGLALASYAIDITGVAQPALLYLVPCVLIPVVIRAKMRGQLRDIWSNGEPGAETGIAQQSSRLSLLPEINSKLGAHLA